MLLAAEDANDDIENDGTQYADEDHCCQREVDAVVAALDLKVSGQVAEPGEYPQRDEQDQAGKSDC